MHGTSPSFVFERFPLKKYLTRFEQLPFMNLSKAKKKKKKTIYI